MAALSTVILGCRAMAGWRRRRARRWPAAERCRRPALATLDELVAGFINDLGAIRGYCELARSKHPNDPAVTRRLDAAMAACTEVSTSIRELLAGGRKRSR